MVEHVVKKTSRPKIEKVYLCASELQKMQCGVEIPHADNCRMGCPFLQLRPKGMGIKRERVSKLRNRLVNFQAAFDDIVFRWTNKQKEYLAEGKTSDAYIVRHIVELLCEPDLKVAQKKLTSHIMRTKLPLFRNYYHQAREDVKRLRKILKDHATVAKEDEKMKRKEVVDAG